MPYRRNLDNPQTQDIQQEQGSRILAGLTRNNFQFRANMTDGNFGDKI